MRFVTAGFPDGTLVVFPEQVTIIWVGAFFDDLFGHLARGQRAGVDQPVFGDDDIQRVFRMIHVGDHRHDGGYAAVLGGARCDDEGN